MCEAVSARATEARAGALSSAPYLGLISPSDRMIDSGRYSDNDIFRNKSTFLSWAPQ